MHTAVSWARSLKSGLATRTGFQQKKKYANYLDRSARSMYIPV